MSDRMVKKSMACFLSFFLILLLYVLLIPGAWASRSLSNTNHAPGHISLLAVGCGDMENLTHGVCLSTPPVPEMHHHAASWEYVEENSSDSGCKALKSEESSNDSSSDENQEGNNSEEDDEG